MALANKLESFFIYCANADADIISQCPSSEKNKNVSIGVLIFLTSFFAFFAGFYFVSLFSNDFTALILGFAWSFLIFNLDRSIIGSIYASDGFLKKSRNFSFRFLIAIAVSLSISHFLTLKIFEPEINAEIAVLKQTDYEEKLERHKNATKVVERHSDSVSRFENDLNSYSEKYLSNIDEIEDNQNNIQTLSKERRQLLSITYCECGDDFDSVIEEYKVYEIDTNVSQWAISCSLLIDQNLISNDPRKGPKCIENVENLKSNIDREKLFEKRIELLEGDNVRINKILNSSNLFIEATSENFKDERKVEEELQNNILEKQSEGLLARSYILFGLVNDPSKPEGMLIVFSVFLLMLVIELSPIVAKFLQKPGEYEELKELHKFKTISIKFEFFHLLSNSMNKFSGDYYKNRINMIENYRKKIDELIIQRKEEFDVGKIDKALESNKGDNAWIEKLIFHTENIDSSKKNENLYSNQKNYSKKDLVENEVKKNNKVFDIVVYTAVSGAISYFISFISDADTKANLGVALMTMAVTAPIVISHSRTNGEKNEN